jgi:hypothetical protein
MLLSKIRKELDKEFVRSLELYDHYKKIGNAIEMHQASAKSSAYSHAMSLIDNFIQDCKKESEKQGNKAFLDKEAISIIEKMTDSPFAIKGRLWLYWLFKLDLIPGSWTATFYLEENHYTGKIPYSFTGCGSPTSAVKEAYKKIDKKWLKKGLVDGKKLNDAYMIKK